MASGPGPEGIFVQYRPDRRRRWAVLVVAGVAVLVLGLIYLVRVVAFAPESTVDAYFTALADRDPARAVRLLTPEVAAGLDRELVTREVLGSEGYTPPARVEVGAVTVTGVDALAEVAFEVAGERHRATLRLRRGDGAVDRAFQRWRIVDGFGAILVRDGPDEVTVNGLRVSAYDRHGPRALSALPGAYRLGVPADDPVWEERSVPVRVAPQRVSEVAAPMQVRPEVRADLEAQVRARLDACARRAEPEPPGCPFGYPRGTRAEQVQWRIDSYPVLTVGARRDGDRTVVAVGTARDGEAAVSGERPFVGEFEATVPVTATGRATLRDGGLVFEPDW